ncbi:septum formation inhibitor [Nitrobacter sp. Nb-311A]|uniref:septum site-determining protein MinC n=1 Tax=Nitrobacter sp. Nb-311A TaxID=314253 RepID=UPI0000687A3A|nr:septum site-determining protein MinC [Nitrobacter sp. Nb-311A]EAQ36367.1 septum formation inhibitor [Nitrobacter sp. Nb-311A]
MDSKVEPQRQVMRLRGRSYIAFVFSPFMPIVNWLEEIDATLARSPGFFVGRPIVLDLSAVDLSSHGIAHLVSNLESRGIRVLGLEGVEATGLDAGLPPVLIGGRGCAIEQAEPKQVEDPRPPTPSLLLQTPVRSGQRIVFAEGDITVLGSVGSGAEIVAGGSIHVYGTLRGRAMAGINGNAAARIYCQKIEAELVAIDGYYQTAEDIGETLRRRPAQAWLDGEVIRITPLN